MTLISGTTLNRAGLNLSVRVSFIRGSAGEIDGALFPDLAARLRTELNDAGCRSVAIFRDQIDDLDARRSISCIRALTRADK